MFSKLWTWNVNVDEELKVLRSKVNHLAAQEYDNSILVENEEIQPGKKRKREVELWFTNVQDKKAAFEQIQTEFKGKSTHNNLKNRIENLTKEVDELIQHGTFPKGVVLDDHATARLPLVTTELVGQSCSQNIASILGWLKEDDALAIGIHGMGGVGKTTIMKHIHNMLCEVSDFGSNVYWVTASQECSIRKLQVDIGKALHLDDLPQYDAERRKALLFRGFSKLGKFVLFIDDLWKHYPFEDIGIPCNLRGCKMIVSTRSLDVCKRIKCHKTIKIVPLAKQDAMELFVKTLGSAVPIALNTIAEKIVAECGGLPLALKTMGCCMRGMDYVYEWENALLELRTLEIRQDTMEEEVFRVLKFSYNNLDDEKMQHCFLSCALFPEDHFINPHDLVKLWINEGLFDEVENDQEKVNRGQAILNRLEKLCLLELYTKYDGGEYVKIHDLIRDMAIIITLKCPRFMAKSRTNLNEVPEKEQWSEDLLKISLSWNYIREIPSTLAPLTMKLSVLLLNYNPLKEIPESFFVHMRALRVLDLSYTEIERLPSSVCNMESLRALLLGSCRHLTYVPALEKLVNLKILDLSHTKIERLPESVSNLENLRELLLEGCRILTYIPSLARLTNLRVLNLEDDEQLERAPRGLEELKKVEELPYCPWNVNNLSQFCSLVKSLPSLTCYSFWLSTSGKVQDFKKKFQFSAWARGLDYEKTIWINGAEFGKNDIVLVPITIEALMIKDSEIKGKRQRLGDVFPSLSEATNLEKLHIEECRGLEYILGSCLFASLGTLKEIYLEGLPDLKELGLFGRCSLPNLITLVIHKCPKLQKVFPIRMTNHQSIPNLHSLIVSGCKEMEQIFESNDVTPPNSNFLVFVVFELCDLPKLGSIYKGLLLSTCVEIHRCPKLKVLKGEEVVCDASPLMLASILSEHAKGWWEDLHEYFPHAASELYNLLNEIRPPEREAKTMAIKNSNPHQVSMQLLLTNNNEKGKGCSSRWHNDSQDHTEAISNTAG